MKQQLNILLVTNFVFGVVEILNILKKEKKTDVKMVVGLQSIQE